MLSPGNTHNKRANAMHQAATLIYIDNCEPVRETPCATWAGVVVLSGPHPEADASWFEAAGIGLEHKPDARLLRSLLVELGR